MLTDYHVHLRPDEPGTTAERYFTAGNAERYREAYRAQIDHFADVVHGRAVSRTDYADGVAALILAEACAWSAQHEQVFTL